MYGQNVCVYPEDIVDYLLRQMKMGWFHLHIYIYLSNASQHKYVMCNLTRTL